MEEVTVTITSLSPVARPVSPVTTALAPASVGAATTVTDVVPEATTRTSPSSTSLPLIVKVARVVVIPLALAAVAFRPCIGTRISSVAMIAVIIFLTVIVLVSLFVSMLLIMLSPSLCKSGLCHLRP